VSGVVQQLIIFQVLQAFARSVKVDVLGHTLSLDLTPCPESLSRAAHKIKAGGSVKFLANDELLHQLVQDHLNGGGNIAWVPDALERS